MVRRVATLTALALMFLGFAHCADRRESRRLRDETSGRMENTSFSFESEDGLLHVISSSETQVVTRASAPRVSFTVTRKNPTLTAVEVRVNNLPRSLTSTDATSRTWVVDFATQNTVKIELAEPEKKPFTLVAFGDIQDGIKHFSDVVSALNQETDPEFLLLLGDLTQTSTPSQFDAVRSAIDTIKIPTYLTPGNHDVIRDSYYQDNFGRSSYCFTYRGSRLSAVACSCGALLTND